MDINGITTSQIELLEAAGYLDVSAFQSVSAEEMHHELKRANGMLAIVERVPELEVIESWRRQVVGGGDESVKAKQVEAVTSSEEREGISRDVEGTELPVAQPLSRKFIARHQIAVEQLPRLVDTRPASDLKNKAELPNHTPPLVERTSNFQKEEIEKEKLRSIDEARREKISVSALPKKNGEIDRTKVVKPETNEGVNPNSRNYVRGVLHNDQIGTSFGAYAFVSTILLVILSLAPIVYIVLNPQSYMFGLLTPALWIVAISLYLSSARKTTCPVCRQRQFVPKSCLKHNKAHHIRGLGHMLPTAIHLICFRWFRCVFCGTSIRVKE
ncbi:hypothetical protein ACFPK9_03095 [Rubritalea spongiae]|uniref:DUF4332 domain-containing protein n=1 Tax=Rubritalea spongiae TaxID=430797 RepID=A0ABW5E5Y6_9BACT